MANSRCRLKTYVPGYLSVYACKQQPSFVWSLLGAFEEIWPDNPRFSLVTRLVTSHAESMNQSATRNHPKDTDLSTSYEVTDFVSVLNEQSKLDVI